MNPYLTRYIQRNRDVIFQALILIVVSCLLLWPADAPYSNCPCHLF